MQQLLVMQNKVEEHTGFAFWLVCRHCIAALWLLLLLPVPAASAEPDLN